MRICCLAAACLCLSACVPWTVRPIGESEESQQGPFDAAAYVNSIWQSKVLPAVAAAPVWSGARCGPCLVKGQGRVVAVDTSSRAGLAFLENGITLQIGPVIRGTALRDALPFIQFSQFTNQLEFARVGNALNERISKMLATVDVPHLQGADIAFAGVLEPGSPPTAVPVTLTLIRRSGS